MQNNNLLAVKTNFTKPSLCLLIDLSWNTWVQTCTKQQGMSVFNPVNNRFPACLNHMFAPESQVHWHFSAILYRGSW